MLSPVRSFFFTLPSGRGSVTSKLIFSQSCPARSAGNAATSRMHVGLIVICRLLMTLATPARELQAAPVGRRLPRLSGFAERTSCLVLHRAGARQQRPRGIYTLPKVASA